MALTIEDDIGNARYEGVLFALALEQRAKHPLVVCDDLVEIEEHLVDERAQSLLRNCRRVDERLWIDLHFASEPVASRWNAELTSRISSK